ncbi:phosphoglycerate dehydrogenase [bacterium]|nr:phosphoglycerate dehydrogenase [bacterium]
MLQTSYPREKVRILLLEGIHESAVTLLSEKGYGVERITSALTEEELSEKISDVHLLGIRSKTEVSQAVLERAVSLLGIGCFCIGTNQVDIECAARRAVPVFNAPFSNTRSVAELTVAEIVMLARRACWRSQQMHAGVWEKSAGGSSEVRGKRLGIVGYGHIGPQVGLLAESLGMEVLFFDISKKLPLGNARAIDSLEGMLPQVDFLSLHVPETPDTKNMIGAKELGLMKQGSALLNLSRGSVVVLDDLAAALKNNHLSGAAVDVFPSEPAANGEGFKSLLQGLPNVILTPHVGGSTVEAQESIGREVAESLLRFLETGSSVGAVNFPHVDLPYVEDSHRVLNIHRNEPGVLSRINAVIADTGANITRQYLATHTEIGYLIMDVERELSYEIKKKLEEIDANIKTRLLF